MTDKINKTVTFYSPHAQHRLSLPGYGGIIQFKKVAVGPKGFGKLVTNNPAVIEAIKNSKYYKQKKVHDKPPWLKTRGTTASFKELAILEMKDSEETKEFIEAKSKELASEYAAQAVKEERDKVEKEKADAAKKRQKLIAQMDRLSMKIADGKGGYKETAKKEDIEKFETIRAQIVG